MRGQIRRLRQVGRGIPAAGGGPTVISIGLAYSTLATVDNKEIFIPNSQVAAAKIINYTKLGKRRVELTFSASYDAPTETVKQALGEVLARLAEDTGWSRTTVHTYLTRMMAKGLVAADAQSPRRYSAARSRESCVAEEERSLADRAYGGSAGRLVAAFVRSGQLGREERAELRRLLDEMEV